MTPQEIENLSSLLQLLLIPVLGLYIDIYSGPVKLKVDSSWLDLSLLDLVKILSDSSEFISGYNFLVSIDLSLYFYVYPGRGKGSISIDQHRKELDSDSYSDASTSYSSYYGVFAVNGQTDYLRIQASGDLVIDPHESSDCLYISIQRRLNL